jgi:hypothetical protein
LPAVNTEKGICANPLPLREEAALEDVFSFLFPLPSVANLTCGYSLVGHFSPYGFPPYGNSCFSAVGSSVSEAWPEKSIAVRLELPVLGMLHDLHQSGLFKFLKIALNHLFMVPWFWRMGLPLPDELRLNALD